MNKLTYYRLRKIATGNDGTSFTALSAEADREAIEREKREQELDAKTGTQHDPIDVYQWAFGNAPQVSAREFSRSQSARRRAYESLPYASQFPLGSGTYVPVIPHPSDPAYSMYYGTDEDGHVSPFYSIIQNSGYNRPIFVIGRRNLPDIGPAYTPADGRVYSGVVYANDEQHQAELLRILQQPENINHPRLREIRALYQEGTNHPSAAVIHELYGHGATPAMISHEPMVSVPDRVLNNPRGSYGLQPAEGLGGMHLVKGFWYRRHPNEPLSDNWSEAVEQFRSKGYLDANGQFTDRLFEGTGYAPVGSTINSIMETWHRQNELLRPAERQQFLDQLQWYWPQANNNRYRRYGNYA